MCVFYSQKGAKSIWPLHTQHSGPLHEVSNLSLLSGNKEPLIHQNNDVCNISLKCGQRRQGGRL